MSLISLDFGFLACSVGLNNTLFPLSLCSLLNKYYFSSFPPSSMVNFWGNWAPCKTLCNMVWWYIWCVIYIKYGIFNTYYIIHSVFSTSLWSIECPINKHYLFFVLLCIMQTTWKTPRALHVSKLHECPRQSSDVFFGLSEPAQYDVYITLAGMGMFPLTEKRTLN